MLTQFVFERYFSVVTRLGQPKDPVLEVLPFIIAKAVLIAFEEKVVEQFGTLIACSDLNTDKIAKEMADAEAASTKANDGDGDGPKKIASQVTKPTELRGALLSSENMLYMFCLGLFNSNEVSMRAVHNMKMKYVGKPDKG